MQLDQPEVFVYFLLNRRLFFPTDKRTPSNPTALCNLDVRQFVLGCENGRTGVEVLAIGDFPIHIASASRAIQPVRLIAAPIFGVRRLTIVVLAPELAHAYTTSATRRGSSKPIRYGSTAPPLLLRCTSGLSPGLASGYR